MTETLQRPSRPSRPPRRGADEPGLGPVLTGLLCALTAAALGLLLVLAPVLLVWVTDDRAGSGAVEAVRTAGQLWSVGHGGSLGVPGGELALTPLGLLALPLWLLVRTGRAAGRSRGSAGRRELGRLGLTAAGAYALVAVLVSAVSATDDVRPALVPAAAGAFLLALVGVLAGCLRGAGRSGAAWAVLPARTRRLGRATAVSSAALVGGGALLAGTALALQLPRAADLARSSDPGVVGGVALLLLGLALVPNAAVWGAAWLAGPGFAVGVGTAVGPFGHELGPVPALPLLAALPGSGVPGWAGPLALLVPLAAGILAGRVVARDLPGVGAARVCLEAALVGPVTGALWVVLAWLSGGAAGGERLTEVGPAAWLVGLAVAAAVGLAAVVGAALHRHRARD